MNYIKEINAFYNRQEQVPLTGSAVALWYALMHINNKTRWKNTFTSPGSVLRNKAGLTETSFKRARTELANGGYIKVESRGRGKAPVYKIHSLVLEMGQHETHLLERKTAFTEERMEQSDEQLNELPDQVKNHPPAQQADFEVTHVPVQLADNLPNQSPAPLIKQYNNKTNIKQNNTNTTAEDAGRKGIENADQAKSEPDALKFYQENFGMVSPFVIESLLDWINSLGEELVIEAMKRALEQNKTSWAYVKSILNAWHKKGIRTLGQAEAEYAAFENERKRKGGGNGGFPAGKKDIVPDWYYEEKRKQEEREKERKQRARTNGEEEELRLEGLMREYWG